MDGIFRATWYNQTYKLKTNMNILIIGHGTHGKDTLAEMIQKETAFTFESSSEAASRIFLYDALKEKYGYTSPEECFKDRYNHRDEWHDLICEYNKDDKARLVKDILANSHMYVGMRSDEEVEECLKQGLFDYVIGVFDPRKPLEPTSSFSINMWEKSDFIIPNAGTLEDLKRKVGQLLPLFFPEEIFIYHDKKRA